MSIDMGLSIVQWPNSSNDSQYVIANLFYKWKHLLKVLMIEHWQIYLNYHQRMGILLLKKHINRDKCSFLTKQRMFGVFAIDEILRYRWTRFAGSHTLCHPAIMCILQCPAYITIPNSHWARHYVFFAPQLQFWILHCFLRTLFCLNWKVARGRSADIWTTFLRLKWISVLKIKQLGSW